MPESDLHQHLTDAAEAGYPALTAEIARACLQHTGESFGVLMHLGMALQALARYDEAAHVLQRAEALAAGPERTLVLRQRGLLAEHRGQVAEATALFEAAIALAPEDPRGYVYLGAMCARLGRLDDAARVLRRAVTCPDGELDEAYYNLALVLRGLGEYLEARACFRAALELDPAYPAAAAGLADVERVLFDFPAA